MIEGAKPCPFCGSTDLFYDYDCCISIDFTANISCGNCFTTGPIELFITRQEYAAYQKICEEHDEIGQKIYKDMLYEDARELALKLWNKRIHENVTNNMLAKQ